MGERHEQRGRRISRTVGFLRRAIIALSALTVTIALVTTVPFPRLAGAVGALTDVAAQKSAAKCQQLIAKTTAKALAGKLKAFNGCAAAALACVQSKRDVPGCDVKANATCSKKLGGAAAAAVKAKTKITTNKSCVALATPDLLAADGLGFGAIAGTCAADYGIDVCQGLAPIADCVLTSHDAGAGGLLGRAAPRTHELLALLPDAPFGTATGLPPYAGCGTCGAPTAAQKPVEKCGKALAAGMQAASAVLEGAYGACALDLYECAQLAGDDAACIAKATAGCTKQSAKVAKAFAKLDTVASKACGTDFAAASAASGLALGSLATRCADLGVATLDGPAAVAACLGAEARCAIATLVRNSVPRTAELSTATLGGLAADLTATCPTASALQTASFATSARTTAQRGLFGSILKLVTAVRRTTPSAVGIRASGGKPGSTGAGGGVSKVKGPTKATFGGISKFNVSYHKSRGRIGGGGADNPAPVLIVAVTRSDSVLDDHFEIPLLTTPGDGSDVEDEVEIEFSDTLPSCAFELNFATADGGEVGDYASILQVLDEQAPTPTGPEIVSRGPADVQQDGAADGTSVAVSVDGRYVAFTSVATNLVTPADANSRSDVFVRDRCVSDGVPIAGCTPATTLETVGPGGEPFTPTAFGHVAISDDGRFVAFDASVDRDPNPPLVVTYVKDRCIARGQAVDSCTVVTTDVTFENETFNSGGVLTSLSSDGRYVLFTSDTIFGGNPDTEVYLLDRCVSTSYPVDGGCESFLDRVSSSQGGGPSNGDADFGTISRGGRFTAFRSSASDILGVGVDTNGQNDVYVTDRCIDPFSGNNVPECAQNTARVNLGPNLAESLGDDPTSGGGLTNIAISDDGRYVAFASGADDLLAAGLDTNGERDVFVRDRCVSDGIVVDGCTQTTERVNVGPGGTESNGTIPAGIVLGLSANGRLIVFASDATNLLGPAVGTPDGTYQVFLRDRCLDKGVAIPSCTPATTLVSAAPDGGRGVGLSRFPAIAAGGATTGFISSAENLLGPGIDANKKTDVFVRDR